MRKSLSAARFVVSARSVRLTLCLALLPAVPALAVEEGLVGDLQLLGLARDVAWPTATPGYAYTVVCGIDVGTELALQAAPRSSAATVAGLARFTTVEVDTRERDNGWVKVVGGDVSYDPAGQRRAYRSLLLEGWASDEHLCAYVD